MSHGYGGDCVLFRRLRAGLHATHGRPSREAAVVIVLARIASQIPCATQVNRPQNLFAVVQLGRSVPDSGARFDSSHEPSGPSLTLAFKSRPQPQTAFPAVAIASRPRKACESLQWNPRQHENQQSCKGLPHHQPVTSISCGLPNSSVPRAPLP